MQEALEFRVSHQKLAREKRLVAWAELEKASDARRDLETTRLIEKAAKDFRPNGGHNTWGHYAARKSSYKWPRAHEVQRPNRKPGAVVAAKPAARTSGAWTWPAQWGQTSTSPPAPLSAYSPGPVMGPLPASRLQ
jgi:hypothetical protein